MKQKLTALKREIDSYTIIETSTPNLNNKLNNQTEDKKANREFK